MFIVCEDGKNIINVSKDSDFRIEYSGDSLFLISLSGTHMVKLVSGLSEFGVTLLVDKLMTRLYNDVVSTKMSDLLSSVRMGKEFKER